MIVVPKSHCNSKANDIRDKIDDWILFRLLNLIPVGTSICKAMIVIKIAIMASLKASSRLLFINLKHS